MDTHRRPAWYRSILRQMDRRELPHIELPPPTETEQYNAPDGTYTITLQSSQKVRDVAGNALPLGAALGNAFTASVDLRSASLIWWRQPIRAFIPTTTIRISTTLPPAKRWSFSSPIPLPKAGGLDLF